MLFGPHNSNFWYFQDAIDAANEVYVQIKTYDVNFT